MGIDLKKEIKLSDLFARRSKKSDAPAEAKKQPSEKRRFFARKGKEASEPGPPKEKRFLRRRPKQPREPKESLERNALPVPDTPLMRAFNLMPKSEAREVGPRARLAYVLVALLGVLTVAGLAGGFFHASAQVGDKEARRDEVRLKLAEVGSPAEQPEATGDPSLLAERRNRATAVAQALAQRVVWDRLLREISLVVPADVFLDSVQAQSPTTAAAPAAPAPGAPAQAPTTFTVVGCAADQDTVAELLARLATVPEFAEVQLVSSTVVAASECGKPVTFTIGAALKPLGAA